MERRSFIKSSCNFCLMAAAGVALNELAACSPAAYSAIKSDIVNNKVSIPINNFDSANIRFIRPRGWYYDIALQKNSTDNFTAVLLQCTHQQNQLNVSSNGYTCTLHGSMFTMDGNVVKGPAERPLKKYPTTIENGYVIIHL